MPHNDATVIPIERARSAAARQMPHNDATVIPIERARSAAARQMDAQSRELQRRLSAAIAGDQQAWSAIVAHYDSLVRGVARRHRLAATDVDDVVQTTWLRLVGHVGEIRRAESLPAWLQTTATRASVDLIRAARREQPAEEAVFERCGTSDDPDGRLTDAERGAALRNAIETLPERHRELMWLFLRQPDISYGQVARTLEMPIGSIGPIRARSLARLRRNRQLQDAA